MYLSLYYIQLSNVHKPLDVMEVKEINLEAKVLNYNSLCITLDAQENSILFISNVSKHSCLKTFHNKPFPK